jgi:hypothetical protein
LLVLVGGLLAAGALLAAICGADKHGAAGARDQRIPFDPLIAGFPSRVHVVARLDD